MAWLRMDVSTGVIERETYRLDPPSDISVKGWRWLEVVANENLSAWEREGNFPAQVSTSATTISREVDSIPLTDWKSFRIANLRDEASTRITAFAPIHMQLNYVARAGELAFKLASTGSLTSDEQAEAATLQSLFAGQVNPIRQACNDAEAAVNTANDHADVEIAYSGVQWP